MKDLSFLFLSVFLISNDLVFAEEPVKVTGEVLGFENIRRDDVVDAALVVPSLKAIEILQFKVEDLLAPEEEMKAGPFTTSVPGNMYVPRQQEHYGFIPVTLRKESFSFYPKKNQIQELSAIHFKASFSGMIDALEKKAPPTELLKLANYHRFGFLDARDWSQEDRIEITLNQSLINAQNYTWTRSAPQNNEVDLLLSFQETPLERWALSAFETPSSNKGKITYVDQLRPQSKILLLRVRSENKKIRSAVGWIRDGLRNGDEVKASGLPVEIRNISLVGQELSWGAIHEPGWIAVAKRSAEGDKEFYDNYTEPQLIDLGFGFRSIELRNIEHQWIEPSQGVTEFSSPIREDDDVLIFYIGSSQEVPSPDSDTDSNPELFNFAREFRMSVVQ